MSIYVAEDFTAEEADVRPVHHDDGRHAASDKHAHGPGVQPGQHQAGGDQHGLGARRSDGPDRLPPVERVGRDQTSSRNDVLLQRKGGAAHARERSPLDAFRRPIARASDGANVDFVTCVPQDGGKHADERRIRVQGIQPEHLHGNGGCRRSGRPRTHAWPAGGPAPFTTAADAGDQDGALGSTPRPAVANWAPRGHADSRARTPCCATYRGARLDGNAGAAPLLRQLGRPAQMSNADVEHGIR